MDPQIEDVYASPDWAVTHYSKYMDDALANGDELGLHPHDFRWDARLDDWIVDHGNQPWVNHCVNMAFETFRATFGKGCDSFRYGDRWMNDETLHLVESLGARFDLTVEPGKVGTAATYPNKPFSGSLPDFTNVPLTPYRPSREDFRKIDDTRTEGIWVIPHSASIYNEEGALSRFWERIVQDKPSRPRYYTLNLSYDPGFFRNAVHGLLYSAKSSYLTFVMRTDIGTDTKRMTAMQENINTILSHRLVKRFVFSTPAEAMVILGLEASRDRLPHSEAAESDRPVTAKPICF